HRIRGSEDLTGDRYRLLVHVVAHARECATLKQRPNLRRGVTEVAVEVVVICPLLIGGDSRHPREERATGVLVHTGYGLGVAVAEQGGNDVLLQVVGGHDVGPLSCNPPTRLPDVRQDRGDAHCFCPPCFASCQTREARHARSSCQSWTMPRTPGSASADTDPQRLSGSPGSGASDSRTSGIRSPRKDSRSGDS